MTRASDVSTYDDDFFAWTHEQAALLRALTSTGDVDVAHVAEEIEAGASATSARWTRS